MNSIKQYIIDNDINQRSLSQKLNIDETILSKIINGKRKLNLEKLLLFLEIRNTDEDKICLKVLKEIYKD